MAALVPTSPTCDAPAPCPTVAVPRPMVRCECAGVPFSEVARQVHAEGRPLGEVLRRTGCGQNCQACLPDLARYLARHP